MTDIVYPTIDLFIYDLIESLGDAGIDIEENRKYFQSRLPKIIHPNSFEFEQDFGVEYAHFLKQIYIPLETSSTSYSFEGYYYPVRLGDTYGLLIECAFKNKTEPQSAQRFTDIKNELENNIQKGKSATLGQTWMISGWLPPSKTKSPEEIAKNCYRALMPHLDWERELDGTGRFLGATIFELSRERLSKQLIKDDRKKIEVIHNNQHVIIALYSDEATYNQSGKFYADWMRLFYYHHKILWAYGQSQILNRTMKTDFSLVRIETESINSNLTQRQDLNSLQPSLSNIQKILNNYTFNLNLLNFQSSTIETNISNYQKRLTVINQKARENSDLNFLTEFNRIVNDKYLLQIKINSDNLERGFELLKNINNAVSNQVQVENAKSNRNFQDIVAVVGSITATVSILKEGKNECKFIFKNNYSFCEYTLFYSILGALVVGLVVLWLRKKLV